MNVTIRKAIEADRKGIADVYADAFEKDWMLLHKDKRVVAMALAEGLHIEYYTIAEKDGTMVGMIAGVEKEERAFSVPIKAFQKYFGFFKGYMMGKALQSDFNKSLHLPDNTLYIDILGVCKHAQGQGIGTQLLQYLLTHKKNKRYTLTVTNTNEHAMHCYHANGFVEYDRKSVKYAKQKGFSEMIYMESKS